MNQTLKNVFVGFHFLRFAREDEQRRFYRALENLLTFGNFGFFGPLNSNEFTTLVHSLPSLVPGRRALILEGIVFKDKSEVELLAAAVGPHSKSIHVSSDSENSLGFIDPLLRALSQRHQPTLLCLSGYDRPVNGPSLITVKALRFYLHAAINLSRVLSLNQLGLRDDHCKENGQAATHVQHDTKKT
jgi:hypothetical protein